MVPPVNGKYATVSSVPSALRNPPLLLVLTKDVAVRLVVNVLAVPSIVKGVTKEALEAT